MTRTLSLVALPLAFVALTGCGIGDAQSRLRSAIDVKGPELNQCYSSALTRDRNAAGTMQAYVYVNNAEGRVDQVEFTGGDVSDPALESCMTDALTQVQLTEAPPTNLKVEYTFQLTPQG